MYCGDYENIALGCEEARYGRPRLERVVERLLVSGDVVVRRAYADWSRYRDAKERLHAEAFELMDVPQTRQAGKNSADIRLVVDAMDLCHVKPQVDTFAVLSGDSDFCPPVWKLRENGRTVTGVGVRNSTAKALIGTCDQFIFYDELMRERTSRTPGPNGAGEPTHATTRDDVIAQTWETVRVLSDEREGSPLWGSMIKQALRRQDPGFDERRHGFARFHELLKATAQRHPITLQRSPGEGTRDFVVEVRD